MGEQTFVKNAKRIVTEYANRHLDPGDGIHIIEDDVYIVWLCKVLQNNKALLSTNLYDGMYYEVTYNGDKDEFYLDAYKKFQNVRIRPDEAPEVN